MCAKRENQFQHVKWLSYFPWDIVRVPRSAHSMRHRSVMLNKNILPYVICKNIINKFTKIYSSPLISGPLIMYVSVFQQNCQRKYREHGCCVYQRRQCQELDSWISGYGFCGYNGVSPSTIGISLLVLLTWRQKTIDLFTGDNQVRETFNQPSGFKIHHLK